MPEMTGELYTLVAGAVEKMKESSFTRTMHPRPRPAPPMDPDLQCVGEAISHFKDGTPYLQQVDVARVLNKMVVRQECQVDHDYAFSTAEKGAAQEDIHGSVRLYYKTTLDLVKSEIKHAVPASPPTFNPIMATDEWTPNSNRVDQFWGAMTKCGSVGGTYSASSFMVACSAVHIFSPASLNFLAVLWASVGFKAPAQKLYEHHTSRAQLQAWNKLFKGMNITYAFTNYII